MKLFKPQVHWIDTPTVREVSVTVPDTEYRIAMRRDMAGRDIKVNVFPPEWTEVTDDAVDFPDELVFLAGAMSVLKTPAVGLLSAATEEMRLASLGTLNALALTVFRQIEYLPRAAECHLELFYQSDLSGIPPQLGMLLLGPSIMEALVTQETDYERSMREKYVSSGNLTPQALEELTANELPPPSYQYVVPAVPAEAVEAFAKLYAQRQLAAMTPQGTA